MVVIVLKLRAEISMIGIGLNVLIRKFEVILLILVVSSFNV